LHLFPDAAELIEFYIRGVTVGPVSKLGKLRAQKRFAGTSALGERASCTGVRGGMRRWKRMEVGGHTCRRFGVVKKLMKYGSISISTSSDSQ
jgi:hypothetical protein